VRSTPVAALLSDVVRRTRCRALLGGFGVPGLRDLDFGRNFVSYVEHLEWPEGVVVEEVPSSALLVLHRLQELRPDKLVIVVATARADSPGFVRRYDLTDRPTVEVGPHAADALTSTVDLDHTLALARQWGALPETVIIEVEPAETTLGLGFSEEVGGSLDRILALVEEELGLNRHADGDAGSNGPSSMLGHQETCDGDASVLHVERASGPDHDLLDDRGHRPASGWFTTRRRSSVRFDQLPHVQDLVLAARRHPGHPGRRKGCDWCDVIPLDYGWTGILIGEVRGHGLDAVTAVTELRTAARAAGSRHGHQPGLVLARLDGVVDDSEVAEIATALCVAVHPRTGLVRLANAGHCPPLLCTSEGSPVLCEEALSAPLGTSQDRRPETSFCFPPDASLLLFTSGLVDRPGRQLLDCMSELASVADSGPRDLEGLCDYLVTAAQRGLPPGEGGCLLGLRLAA
jgi:hydrogenase maturation protease